MNFDSRSIFRSEILFFGSRSVAGFELLTRIRVFLEYFTRKSIFLCVGNEKRTKNGFLCVNFEVKS